MALRWSRFGLGLAMCGLLSACVGAPFNEGGDPDGGQVQGPSDDSDDDPAPALEASVVGGVSILPAGGLVTSESGEQASFEIALVNPPSADVRIPLESSDPTEGTILVEAVTFTPDDWDAPQTVVITGQDDQDVDGNQSYRIITSAAESDDPQYSGVDPADVAVANLDDDEVGIRFEPSAGLITSESGLQATFTARLTSQPQDDVAVFLASSDEGEGTVVPSVLTFTPQSWSSPQTVTVTGVDDDEPDGSVSYSISVSDIISGDDAYGSLDFSELAVELENRDDDSAGVSVTGDDLIVSEAGQTASFTVALNRAPSDVVLIRVASSDESEGQVSPALLTFTPNNWNAHQEVQVLGVDDDEADGDQEFTVELEDATSEDPAYDGIDVPDVTVVNIDDESAGFLVTPSQVQVGENGGTDVFSVRLTAQPSARVVIALGVNDPTEAELNRTELAFDDETWATPQEVEVRGVDDDEIDGNQTFLVLTSPAQSEDDDYRGLNPPDITGQNIDDETPGISVNPTSGLMTSEDGSQAEFSVVLLARPSAPVRVILRSDDETEGEVMPTELEFGTDDWNQPVTVLLSGVDDDITDGAQPFNVIAEIDSDDEAYAELVVPVVSATNRDDECLPVELIDDLSDQDLLICPNEGRSGTWGAENSASGIVELEIVEDEAQGFSLHAIGRQANDYTPSANPFLNYPILSVAFFGTGEPQPFDASAYSGIRFTAHSAVNQRVRVAVPTTDTWDAATTETCPGGCTGHAYATFQMGISWTEFTIDFSKIETGASRADFDPAHVVGLKFLGELTIYQLWLDDVTFIK